MFAGMGLTVMIDGKGITRSELATHLKVTRTIKIGAPNSLCCEFGVSERTLSAYVADTGKRVG